MVEEPEQMRPGLLIDFPINTSGQGGLSPRQSPQVGFDRKELSTILDLYGRKVADGEWRDYAMDFLRDRALFSVYRGASERPLYVIEKNPRLRARQGPYLVTAQDGRVLKRGHELGKVLRVLELAVVR